MSRPRGFADLAGRTVGIFGVGVEGTATERRLSSVGATIVLVDDIADEARGVLATAAGGREALEGCEVVLKSPGIPRRRDDVVALERSGVIVTSSLNLWMHETDRDHVIAVTGTKGKSTTTSLITFMLEALGESAVSAGNIGRAPYDPLGPLATWTVVEVSSFQALDLEVAPFLVVVTSLGADHLDWHGSLEQYHEDKLALTRAPGDHVTLVANDPNLLARRDLLGGDLQVISEPNQELATRLHLLGAHNARNVSLAIAACARALRRDSNDVASVVLDRADEFVPLAGRFSLVRTLDNVEFIDDGLATADLPTIAALDVVQDQPVALIVGGFDRGIDYGTLASVLAARLAPTTLITMPDVGERIGEVLRAISAIPIHAAATMDQAVALARAALVEGGVVLMSPAAPSFGRYANWSERSADFARAVGNLD